MLLMLQEDAEMADRLKELRAYIDDLELQFAELAAEFAKSRHWETQGSNSGLDWIRFNCHMTSTAAADRIAVGNSIGDMQVSRQAMTEGDIGFAHLTVMARTAKAVGEAFDEGRLLDIARESSPGRFHYQSLHFRHAVNAEQYAREQASQVHSRELFLSNADDGSLFITGCLDTVGGAVVRSALERLARPDGKDDHRTRP